MESHPHRRRVTASQERGALGVLVALVPLKLSRATLWSAHIPPLLQNPGPGAQPSIHPVPAAPGLTDGAGRATQVGRDLLAGCDALSPAGCPISSSLGVPMIFSSYNELVGLPPFSVTYVTAQPNSASLKGCMGWACSSRSLACSHSVPCLLRPLPSSGLLLLFSTAPSRPHVCYLFHILFISSPTWSWNCWTPEVLQYLYLWPHLFHAIGDSCLFLLILLTSHLSVLLVFSKNQLYLSSHFYLQLFIVASINSVVISLLS